MKRLLLPFWGFLVFCNFAYTHASSSHEVKQSSSTFYAKVVGIKDGDTVTILSSDATGKHQIRVRLNEIDAPEKSQDYGKASKKALSDLIFGKTIIVVSKGKDGYGRTLGTLYLGLPLEFIKRMLLMRYKI